MSSYTMPDSVKCVEGKDFEVVKHDKHFEWVAGYEDAIKELTAYVFDTLGASDGRALGAAVDGLDAFQDGLKTKMDAFAVQVASRPGTSERAKTFAADWAVECKHHVDLKYHRMGDGPTAQKVRWAFESAIKYITVCATHLADQRDEDDAEFAKLVSDFERTVVMQSLIDSLKNVKETVSKLA